MPGKPVRAATHGESRQDQMDGRGLVIGRALGVRKPTERQVGMLARARAPPLTEAIFGEINSLLEGEATASEDRHERGRDDHPRTQLDEEPRGETRPEIDEAGPQGQDVVPRSPGMNVHRGTDKRRGPVSTSSRCLSCFTAKSVRSTGTRPIALANLYTARRKLLPPGATCAL